MNGRAIDQAKIGDADVTRLSVQVHRSARSFVRSHESGTRTVLISVSIILIPPVYVLPCKMDGQYTTSGFQLYGQPLQVTDANRTNASLSNSERRLRIRAAI